MRTSVGEEAGVRLFCLLLLSLVLIAVLGPACWASSRTFINETGGSVTGIRIVFSSAVRISQYDKSEFPTKEPQGMASEFVFSGGELRNRGRFAVTWSGASATVVSSTWLTPASPPESPCAAGQTVPSGILTQTAPATALARSGFSLQYDVDLSDPAVHTVSVTLTIHTKGIHSLSLSTSRYHPVVTANSPRNMTFSAEPALGFSVQEATRTHPDPHGNPEEEPVWRLRFGADATIVVRYERVFTHASEDCGNGVTAYLGDDLFLATGERYLILPELREGEMWSGAYDNTLQGITVQYRLPEGWAIWTPWNCVGEATFDPCIYQGSGAASTNLSCLVMSTVVAGPQQGLTARCRDIGGTEVTLVFSRKTAGLDQRAEQLFEAFELVQGLWGEAIDARYLAAFPTTAYRLYSGEWTNSQGYSLDRGDSGSDLWMFLHQIYHRWNGFGVFEASIRVDGWAYKFYGEAWNCYYQDKILNRLRVFAGTWHYCRQWYSEYLDGRGGPDAPVADALRPQLTAEQSDWIAYSKGALVAFMLDHEIQRLTQSRYSLDDVVKEIWSTYGRQKGSFTYDDVKRILLELTGQDFTAFFSSYVFGMERLVISELR